MKFCFHLGACAANNSPFAQSREATRMALICMALRAQGHDAVIASVPTPLMENPRWKYFAGAYHNGATGGLLVVPAETLRDPRRADIAFKCSVGCDHDANRLNRCGLYVAHEYDEAVDEHPKLLAVPFMVHDCVLDHLVDTGLFRAFIDNDLEPIRQHFRNGVQPSEKRTGICCQNWPHRMELLEHAPEWVEWQAYPPAQQPMTGWDHARWLLGFKAALCLRGNSPKTNLPALCAMLGIPMIFEPIARRDTPAFDSTNTIPFYNWWQIEPELRDEAKLARIMAKATEDYLTGWSHVGQARLIAERAGA